MVLEPAGTGADPVVSQFWVGPLEVHSRNCFFRPSDYSFQLTISFSAKTSQSRCYCFQPRSLPDQFQQITRRQRFPDYQQAKSLKKLSTLVESYLSFFYKKTSVDLVFQVLTRGFQSFFKLATRYFLGKTKQANFSRHRRHFRNR